MSCPAVEHSIAVAESNAERLQTLLEEIMAAGVLGQALEVLEINFRPESAYSKRVRN